VVSSCMRALVQINRVRHLFNKREILIKIINCLVFSKLYYCSSVWASTSETNIGKLQCVQNFAARIVTGTKKFEHITPILKDLKWLPVEMELYRVSKKTLWKFNRLSCIINVAKQFNFYIGRKNSYLAFQ
jgi:hypothetical protein